MPLRDHFRPPFSSRRSWDGFHGAWPTLIVMGLNRKLPRRYVAEPQIHLGSSFEIDVATFEEDPLDPNPPNGGDQGGGTATAVWAPSRPTLSVATDLPSMDEYEVRVHDMKEGRRLVAAIELVSPSNKDRPENRRVFAAKCAAMMRDQVCVAVVDLVTTRASDLYGELLALLGQSDPSLAGETSPLYAASCRWARDGDAWRLDAWRYTLALGESLPTLPLWLAENLAIPLDLETSYEETCQVLRIR